MQGIAEGNVEVRAGQQEMFNEGPLGERRLWLAVVMQAVEDWRGGTLRAKRQAQEFMFEERKDFDVVCANAGLDAENLRQKLVRLGRMVPQRNPFSQYMAA
jgi:hypothetical protein